MISLVKVLLLATTFLTLTIASAVEEREAPAPNFGDNIQLRGELSRSKLKFQNTKTGTVAFLGGSITEMNGYRPMVMENLKKRFPETAFKFINAGISSTTSTTGAFRLDHDVLTDGPVDLLFVEFAVNDDQDGHHSRLECIRAMEGIIRHARKSNPEMDIIITYFVNEGMLQTLQSGKTPLTVEAHETVAKHYDISTVHLAREVAAEITAGKLTWKTYGGVHPAPAGNTICAKMIEDLLTRSWISKSNDSPAKEMRSLQAALDSLNYENGRFIDPSKATIKHGFTLGIPDWTQIAGSKRDRFMHISMLCSTEPGAECTLQFEGTAVGVYVVAGPDAGLLDGTIDGVPFQEVNLFHAFSSGLHYPRTVLLAGDLKPGSHVLVLSVAESSKTTVKAARIIEFVAN
ncbi:MAG: hypothetical protein JWN25_953 [Verrucomicrobiales bacterium]|nr:hypothetical protein [Verrucomicrobiales bacterium]